MRCDEKGERSCGTHSGELELELINCEAHNGRVGVGVNKFVDPTKEHWSKS